ncbi:geranylgeranyl transferase type-2 subunit beta [Nematocida sp. LUAm3]|nr:geranylgeranyl transferase type-2 subunit beta [Nematocida sp. LUAm3]KAI5174013.1 geranylgeranyl transferase type-2 subunit beta [Nematocida sp. LUAm2]KAI5177243.1 geranylgeranyl transferase type-2 subunit beta [Nematocida sp. LUAm1]
MKKELHEYIMQCMSVRTKLFFVSSPMRISTILWGLSIFSLYDAVDQIEELSKELFSYVSMCQNKDGGFGGKPGYPSSPLFTLSAVQIIEILQRNHIKYLHAHKETLPEEGATKRPGEFTINDRWNELYTQAERDSSDILDTETNKSLLPNWIYCNKYLEEIVRDGELIGYNGVMDLRSLMCYVASKCVLAQMHYVHFDYFPIIPPIKEIICEYQSACINYDGGIGERKGCESHNACAFYSLSTLFLIGEVSAVDIDKCVMFISLCQKGSGGFSSRFGVEEDLCASFWAYGALMMCGREALIDGKALRAFVASCHNAAVGTFSERPGEPPTLLHTAIGVSLTAMLDKRIAISAIPAMGLCHYT